MFTMKIQTREMRFDMKIWLWISNIKWKPIRCIENWNDLLGEMFFSWKLKPFFFGFFYNRLATWINKWNSFSFGIRDKRGRNWEKKICMHIYNKSKREKLSCLMAGDRWQLNRSSLDVLLTFHRARATVNWWNFKKITFHSTLEK